MANSVYEVVGAEIGSGITVQNKDVEGTCKYILISVARFWNYLALSIMFMHIKKRVQTLELLSILV